MIGNNYQGQDIIFSPKRSLYERTVEFVLAQMGSYSKSHVSLSPNEQRRVTELITLLIAQGFREYIGDTYFTEDNLLYTKQSEKLESIYQQQYADEPNDIKLHLHFNDAIFGDMGNELLNLSLFFGIQSMGANTNVSI